MTCHSLESLLALYVEGDLHDTERHCVEEHLGRCDRCAALLAGLKQSQVEFKALRWEMPDAATFSKVRDHVLCQVEGQRPLGPWLFSIGGWRKAALAGVALFVLASGLLWMKTVPGDHEALRVEESATAIVPPPLLPEPLPATQSVEAATPVKRRRPPARPAPAEAKADAKTLQSRPQVAIKILTDDPNIIVYWLVDEGGD